jgi:serine/threonine protein kinase
MALAPGTRLGPYAVAAPIGKGGMGEVYRATDLDLTRAVAIKVLPEPVAGDRERLARFQREAEVLRRSTIRTSRRSTASRRAVA